MYDTGNSLSLSIVVPVYAGDDFLEQLVSEIERVRLEWDGLKVPCRIDEVIFVDDSAIDSSARVLDSLARDRPWMTVLHLARNYGQHAATIAGILHSSGDWVITMDEDLQHHPDQIINLLKEAAVSQSDVVYARPSENVHQKIVRDFSSRMYKSVMAYVTGNKALYNANSFRLMRGATARAASSVCAHDTYFDVALSWFTNRFSTSVMTLKDQRYIQSGSSGYSFRSLVSHARKLLISSQIKFMYVGALLGAATAGFSILASIFFLVRELLYPGSVPVQGWVSLMLTILVLGGCTILMIGIVLEYLTLLVQRAHGKPVFFIVDRSSDELLLAYFRKDPC